MRSDMKIFWAKLFWAIADGKATEYEAIKRKEIFEFFTLLRIHEERQIKTQKKLTENGKSNG
jgi:hypothetical protein